MLYYVQQLFANIGCSPFGVGQVAHSHFITSKIRAVTLNWNSNVAGRKRMYLVVSQPEERSCSEVWWYDSRYFCISGQTAVGWVWLEWVLTFSNLWALCRHLTSPMSLMLGGWVPIKFWAVLITRLLPCRDLFSWSIHIPNQCFLLLFCKS